jgi:predicted component of type VI protein secretion system
MDYQLVVTRGRSGSEALNLANGVTTAGRHDDCQIRIKSSQVSRKHCEFFEKKGMLLVKDLGSANGTFVNGKKVAGQQVLEPGDEITIGSVKLRVVKVGEAPPSKAPAKPGKASSDTAVVEAVAVAAGSASTGAEITEDEFEIDFDDVPGADPLFDDVSSDITAPVPPPAAPASVPEPQKKADAEPETADAAIADFLLDIKLDEEE